MADDETQPDPQAAESALDVPSPTILFVCTANVCRSPLAAAQLQLALAGTPWGDVRIGSAGTDAIEWEHMCPVSKSALDNTTFGDDHRSRPLTTTLITDATLIIAMEKEQRSIVAQLVPGTQAKLFTLREAAAIVSDLAERGGAAADPAELAEIMRRRRGSVPLRPAERRGPRLLARRATNDDGFSIPDGHTLGGAAHVDATRAVRAATDDLAAGILSAISATAPTP